MENNKYSNRLNVKKSFNLKYKLPKTFLNRIVDPASIITKEKSLNNYCEIIAKTKTNIKVFKQNLITNLARLILNIVLVILTICLWSIKNTVVENQNIFVLYFLIPIIVIFAITIITYSIVTGFGFIGFYSGTNFNNYVIHREYLRCKLAILMNKQNENSSLDKIHKYFQINVYKFIDDEKIKISYDIKIKNKYDSSLIKWFIMTGWIIIDVIFQLGSLIATILTIVYLYLIK